MTSRGPGWASRTPEMEEKEQLRRQIRLLQGLIDDYKNHHSSAPALSRWQPPAYNSCRVFGTRYPRPSRRGFTPNRGPEWRKKYSLVNRPPGALDPPADGAPRPPLVAEGSRGPDPPQGGPERQVQLSSDQNMVIRIKPTPCAAGVGQGTLEASAEPRWSEPPQGGEGEPPVGPASARGSCGSEDPLLVCRKEPGKPRVVTSLSGRSSSPAEPRRTVSESALGTRPCFPSASQLQRSSTALGQRGSPPAVGSCDPLGQPAASGSLGAPARLAQGSRPTREAAALGACRSGKFRRNNYKWVAASAKSPRPSRRAMSPRATEQARRTLSTPEREPHAPPGASPSKYKWKASSPAVSSCSSFRWQPEAGSKNLISQLSPILSGSPPGDTPAQPPPSAYKVKSRTKIIRRRGSASLSGDKKSSSPPVAATRSQFNLRRRQVLRAKSSPVLKKTPHRGLATLSRQRLSQPQVRAVLSSREVSSAHALRTPPSSKVIKTRYRIVKKNSASPSSVPLVAQAGPSWRSRRLSLSRSLVLNRIRPVTGAGKAQPSSPAWRNPGYRCIGGTLYRVSANKLSKTASRQGDTGSRTPLRVGRLDSASSCGRSLASRAVQRSLAIVRQAGQRRRKKEEEYCTYYNRFGRCSRGEHCPYIHDPEKVAVCTRFVRGTCKKTDGTCPFSHQVSKEKMPVCSYFLKGICSNSSCPYSHVYVSRKAEVCADFLKGYCPLGAKCKKKHTLLCPDFSRRGSCPRGAECQLLHRNQRRASRRAATPAPEPCSTPPRSRASTSHGPRKVLATQRPARQMCGASTSTAAGSASPPSPRAAPSVSSSSSKAPPRTSSPSSSSSPTPLSPSLSLDQEELSLQEAAQAVPSSGGLSKLPSFISLQSTPSPAGQPRAQTPRTLPIKDSGRPLHIKPRL
ncbi:zinc finger CCCH domain-containing protein 3 [Sorex araneus]|uniref:zinc finger CCCH domain-containing protein 3 n=1 Tax=Sorex araneus TaxID=42254 RepID=UPI0003318C9D|nr:zinc finger CCCH domain-containing protein 3 [Sorex araneus]